MSSGAFPGKRSWRKSQPALPLFSIRALKYGRAEPKQEAASRFAGFLDRTVKIGHNAWTWLFVERPSRRDNLLPERA
jgi:hypothetical protein